MNTQWETEERRGRESGERGRREVMPDAVRQRGSSPTPTPAQRMEHLFAGTRSAGWLRSKYNFIAAVVETVAPSVVHLQLFRG